MPWHISQVRQEDLKYRRNQQARRVRDLKGHLQVVKHDGEWVAVVVTEKSLIDPTRNTKWGIEPTHSCLVGRYGSRKEAVRAAETTLFSRLHDDEPAKFKEQYYITGAGYKRKLSPKQEAYNRDGTSNQGEYSNCQAMRNVQKYLDVWERILRKAKYFGVLSGRKPLAHQISDQKAKPSGRHQWTSSQQRQAEIPDLLSA